MSVRVSKFLSLVLRHNPGRIGIVLDEAGWTDVTALLAACAAHGVSLSRDDLAALVASSDKQRFALSPDGERIRANQGHSVEVDLQLAPAEPPPTLFHGTVEAAIASIRAQGLVRGQRHHVHLSADVATATKVGGRRGKPVVLTVRAGDMAAAGHVFYCSTNGVWLVDHVPPEFIVSEAPAARSGKRLNQLGRISVAEQTIAALEAGRYVNARHEVVDIAAAAAAAADGTVLHALGELPRVAARAAPAVIEVTGESTIEALIRLHARPGGHLACLNFASAVNAGGGFLGGAQAQEESLARSSALYPCLPRQPSHYARNRAHDSPHYLDLAMFSPRVPFFRDDDGNWLDRPVLASVVTCAAPNASALRQHGKFDADAVEATLRRRAALVLAVAVQHGVERFVLGAWGAGVFGNDPALVADAFGALLEGAFAGAFAEVVFAIHGGPGRANHDAFARRFAGFAPERG
jgi:putative RNA 2'-phosphotransferase